MRRQPQQERGQRRVDQILDAAAEVFSEQGFETATTNTIAERAHTSIGSLYQFFPNKEVIVATLSKRYADGLLATFSQQDHSVLPCQDCVNLMVDTIAHYYAAEPGFRPMFYGAYRSRYTVQIETNLRLPLARFFAEMIRKLAPKISLDEAHDHAKVVVEVLGRLLNFWFEQPLPNQARTLGQIKHLLIAYLCEVADSNS